MTMKKIVVIFVCVLVLFTIGTASSYIHPAVDCDLNSNNIVETVEVQAAIYTWMCGDYDARYDFDTDGDVSISDILIFVEAWQHYDVLPEVAVVSEEWQHGIEFCKAPRDDVVNWYQNWNTIPHHRYEKDVYDCYHFSTDYKNSFRDDYGIRGVYCAAYEDWIGNHAFTVIYLGGDPLEASNWGYFTNNGRLYPNETLEYKVENLYDHTHVFFDGMYWPTKQCITWEEGNSRGIIEW